MEIHEYDPIPFRFQEIFSEHCRDRVQCPDLTQLHQWVPREVCAKGTIDNDNDQSSWAHIMLYQIDSKYQMKERDSSLVTDRGFIDRYQAFVHYLQKNVFKERLVYQRLPTLRIHFPNNVCTGEFHRDGDYNHPKEEINIVVPLTRSIRTATIHIESGYQKNDHKPVEMEYGQFLIFDSRLEHGSLPNVENYTRISFDFRVIPYHLYRDTGKSTFTQKIPFKIGHYYNLASAP